VPVVITFHGSDIWNPYNKILSWFANYLSSWNIFVSKRLYQGAKKFREDRYDIITCGIDLDLFKTIRKEKARDLLNMKDKQIYILFSSSFSNTIKNYALAKKAIKIIGGIELLELKNYSREKVSLLMNACDLLLVTSHHESGPLVVKEAMACNCPIVSTDVGDVREMINNVEGCFICTFEPEDVTDKIKMALDFGKRTNGREMIIKLGLDSETIARKIIKIYKKIIGELT